uniref:Mono-ADP ribosylhydrolase 1 n=1 Tax=Gouania willdenowi TaxID=441366 RepID=A0A8C5DTU0_GOUWI
MALQLFARGSRSLINPRTTAGAQFKSTLSLGTPSATGVLQGQAGRLCSTASTGGLWRGTSTSSSSSSPRSRAVCLGRIAVGAALGVGTAVLFQSFHSGSMTAMAFTLDLDSATGDWEKTKDHLLSLSVKDRRQKYRTPSFVPLEDVEVWTPTAGGSKPSYYDRNEKLDQKICVYSGDITKLEIDAIVNAEGCTPAKPTHLQHVSTGLTLKSPPYTQTLQLDSQKVFEAQGFFLEVTVQAVLDTSCKRLHSTLLL